MLSDLQEYRVNYLPAESDTGMFGGNSNWRGPVWVPINIMLIRGLLNLYEYYGDSFTIECPTGSGQHKNLYQVANDISERLIGTFRRDADGHRPVHGGEAMLRTSRGKSSRWAPLMTVAATSGISPTSERTFS